MAGTKAAPSPNDVLAAFREAVKTASPEERDALSKELGVGRAIGKPEQRRMTRRQTNEMAQEMSRASGGVAHPPDFVPAPPDWVTEHGGGMNTEEVAVNVRNQKTGSIDALTETAPLPGENAYAGNWAVQIYRDRHLNNLPPLPSAQAYDAERARGSGPSPERFDVEELAAAARE